MVSVSRVDAQFAVAVKSKLTVCRQHLKWFECVKGVAAVDVALDYRQS